MEDSPERQNHDNTLEERGERDALDAFFELGDKLRTSEVQEKIDQLIAAHDPDETQDPTKILLKHGKNLLPDEYYAFLEMYVKLQKMFDLDGDRYEEPAVEIPTANRELAMYVVEEAKQLLYASHVSKLQSGGFTDDEKEIIAAARVMLLRLINLGDMSDDDAQERHDQLEQCRTMLAGTHILEAPAGYEAVGNEGGPYDIDELNRAYELNERYRPRHSSLHPEVAEQKSLLPTHYWQVGMTDETRAYLEEYLRAIDARKDLTSLQIEGLELLPFSLDVSEVGDFLRDIPGITFDGLTGIYFHERPLEDRHIKTDEANGRWEILAEHQHNFETNDTQVLMRADAISRYFEKRYNEAVAQGKASNESQLSARDAARIQTIEYIKDTIVHELGHAFLYRLPVALVNDWDVAVFESITDQPVSRYVEMTDTLQLGSYPIEDFAESFMLCLLHPDQLRDIAPDRAAAMQALIDSCRSQ